jgi:D-sedoheptulose 7-phosphate isomerase
MTILEEATRDAIATIQSLAPFQAEMDRAAELVGGCLTSGEKLLVCGNGGSAGDSADFATEFACRFNTDRRPFPAINLAACGSLLTANANDYGVEEMFARSVRAFGKRGDVLVALTTSGNSANIIAALRAAAETGVHTIGILGRDGGRARGLAEIEFIVPGRSTARIQEAQRFLLHVLCEMVEQGWLLK